MDLSIILDTSTEGLQGAGVNLVKVRHWVVGLSQSSGRNPIVDGDAVWPVTEFAQPVLISLYPGNSEIPDHKLAEWAAENDILSAREFEVWVPNMPAAQNFINWLRFQTATD